MYGFPYGFGKVDPAAFDDYVDVFARASEKTVPDIASYDKCPDTFFFCDVRDD